VDFVVARVALRDGAASEIALDLSPLLPGDLEGLVLHGGTPAANRLVELETTKYHRYVTTDANGRFRLHTRTGEYSLTSRAEDRSMLSAGERAFVIAGRVTTQTFRLR
jgi:hypothetical protein